MGRGMEEGTERRMEGRRKEREEGGKRRRKIEDANSKTAECIGELW